MTLSGALSTRTAGFPRRISWQTLITAVMMIIAWTGTFGEMWLRWFPAWQDVSLSLADRFTQGDSYYLHGPLVPIVSLILAIWIYKHGEFSVSKSRKETIVGWGIFTAAILLHLLSVYARVTFLSGFALIGAMAGLAILRGGWELFKSFAAPILLLVFMVPMPMNAIAELNFELKSMAGKTAVGIVNEIFHVPAIIDGSFIFLSPSNAGAPKQLVLEDVCSGLRSLIALTWFAAFFAATCHVRMIWRMAFLVSAVPLAIGCNVLRIASVILAAQWYGTKSAGTEGWFHQLSGLLAFVLAMGVLLGLEKLIFIFGGRSATKSATKPEMDSISFQNRPFAMVLMIVTAGLSVQWSLTAATMDQESWARQAAPMSFCIGSDMYAGQDLNVDQKTQLILETRDILYRRYVCSALPPIELLIVCNGENRKGTHPPEVCLAGRGSSIVSRQDQPMLLDDGRIVPMRELVSRENNVLKYHLYVYKCGQRYTPSFLGQQAGIFVNSLLHRSVSGTMIRLSVPVDRDDVDEARQIANRAARTIWPVLDRRLP